MFSLHLPHHFIRNICFHIVQHYERCGLWYVQMKIGMESWSIDCRKKKIFKYNKMKIKKPQKRWEQIMIYFTCTAQHKFRLFFSFEWTWFWPNVLLGMFFFYEYSEAHFTPFFFSKFQTSFCNALIMTWFSIEKLDILKEDEKQESPSIWFWMCWPMTQSKD